MDTAVKSLTNPDLARYVRLGAVNIARHTMHSLRLNENDAVSDYEIGFITCPSDGRTGIGSLTPVPLPALNGFFPNRHYTVRSCADMLLEMRQHDPDVIRRVEYVNEKDGDPACDRVVLGVYQAIGAKTLMSVDRGPSRSGSWWLLQIMFPDMSGVGCVVGSDKNLHYAVSSHDIDLPQYFIQSTDMIDQFMAQIVGESIGDSADPHDENSSAAMIRMLSIITAKEDELGMY